MRRAGLILVLSGCSAPASPEAVPSDEVALAVGVSCDPELAPMVGDIAVTIRTPHVDTTHSASALPFEVMLSELAAGDSVEVTAVAGTNAGMPVSRSARTIAFAGEPLLLRLQLNDECLPSSEERDVSCPGQTCIAGLCEDPYVSPSDLEPYRSGWAEPAVDACAPSPGAPAVVTLGHDGEPFAPLDPGAVLVPEWGPQGGTHVWVSIRMHGLQRDSTTTLWADFPGQSIAGSIQKSTARYPASCELHGIRYVLPVTDAWDTAMHLTAVVVDPTGHAGHQHLDLQVGHPDP